MSAIWQIAAPEPQWWSRDGQTVTEDSPYMFDSGLPPYSAAGMWIFTLEEEMATVELTSAAGAFEFFDQPATLFEAASPASSASGRRAASVGRRTRPG